MNATKNLPRPVTGIDEASNLAKKHQRKTTDHPAGKFPKPILACAPYAVLIAAVLLAYSNVYHNEFVYDDLVLITGNKFLTSWNYAGTLLITSMTQGYGRIDAFFRPLQLLLYLFIYQTAGPSTVAFHLLNVALHALNACLLYTLGVRMGFQRVAVMLAALLWALHPVQTEAVTYMSSTTDLLCGVFLLAGILVLARGFSHTRVAVSCLLFALGLLSKETTVVFPVLVMWLLFYRSENRWSFRPYLRTWPFWLIAVLYLLARATVLNFGGVFGHYDSFVPATVTLWGHVCTFLATLPTYLRLLVWPTDLHMDRGFSFYTNLWAPQGMAGLAILAALFAGVVWKPAERATPLAWGILWAGAVHIPVSGILTSNDTMIAEHWLYLPTMGLALGLGESLARFSGHVRVQHIRSVLAGFTVLIVSQFGTMTFEQNKVWHDPVTFYTHIFACGEESASAHNNLAGFYVEKGQYDLAIEHYRRALTLSPTFVDAHFNLGSGILFLYHDSPALRAEGIWHLQRALELNPDYYKAADVLAYFYGHIGDQEKESEYRFRAAAIRQKLGIE